MLDIQINTPPSPEEIAEFNAKINQWKENEKLSNPENQENIYEAGNRIFASYHQSSQDLDLEGLNIESLPVEIGKLINLQYLNISGNKLSLLPPEIGNLVRLHTFYLDENQLTTLPPEIGNLVKLDSFSIVKNQLTSLPEEIANLTNLTTLDLSDNNLTTLPQAIQDLVNSEIAIVDNNPDLELISDDQQDSPRSPAELIDFLCDSANFSNEEKTQPYESFLSLESLTQESEESQALTARLGAMLEFFYSSSSQDSQGSQDSDEQDQDSQGSQSHDHNEQIQVAPNLILAINSFISQSVSWRHANQEQKKHLARYFLTILSQVYERKDDEDFIEQVEIVCRDSLENCVDRNSLLIFNLANFCQRKNSDDLNLMTETQPLQLFNYFKNQLLYNHFLALGQEKVNQIKIENPDFSEDVEVLLNYLRIYNNQFDTSLDLQLPNIIEQDFYDEMEYQPSLEQINKFKIIADKFLSGDLSALQDKLAEIFVNDFDMLPISNPEILSVSFVQKHLQQIENIAQEFLGLFEDYKVSLEKNKPMTDRVYIEKINKIYLFKKQIDKEELKILFQDLLSQLALNQIPSEEFTKEKLATIENKYVKFFNDELEIKVKKKEALKRNLPEAELIGFGASAIKKQTVMDHNKV